MPNIKSQKDRVRLTEKQTLRNKSTKSNLKTVVKKADASIAANSADKDASVKVAISTIDKAATKGVLHKNTAARKISKLMRKAN